MRVDNLPDRDFRVGGWLVQPRLTRIHGPGGEVRVSPKAMSVLVFLAQADGAVVSRDELFSAIWPRMAVTPDALTQCIVELRKAFHDVPRKPTIIETIPKVGIRLVPRVTAVDPVDGGSFPGGPRTETPAHLRPARIAALTLAMVMAVALGGTAMHLLRQPAADPPESDLRDGAGRRSIAVLPFSNDGPADETIEMFANGLHGELLNRLATVSALDKVIARSSVIAYRDSEESVADIARELGVATILEGQAQRMGDAVRINVQLIDTATNGLLWGQSFMKPVTAENYFAIQEQITVAVVDALDAVLSPDELTRVRTVQTRNTSAYEHYLSGNEYFADPDRASSLPFAALQYGRATDEDPDFAAAWAQLGLTHTAMYWLGLDPTPARLSMADAAIEQAFALAPNLPEAHLARANYYYRGGGLVQEALDEFDLAEKSIPQDSVLHFLRSGLYRRIGQWERAIRDGERAVELDPRNTLYLEQLHVTYAFLRNYGRAEQILERIADLQPSEPTTYLLEVFLDLCAAGDTARARQYDRLAPIPDYAESDDATYYLWLAAIFDRDYEKALRILDKGTTESFRNRDPKAVLLARTFALAGRQEDARYQFQQIVDEVESQLASAPRADRRGMSSQYLLLAEASAGLGQRDRASGALQQARDFLPNSLDAVQGSDLQLAAVIQVLLPLGVTDTAMQELDDYLGRPGRWTIEGLSADPRFDSVRGDPRFRTLERKYARRPQ